MANRFLSEILLTCLVLASGLAVLYPRPAGAQDQPTQERSSQQVPSRRAPQELEAREAALKRLGKSAEVLGTEALTETMRQTAASKVLTSTPANLFTRAGADLKGSIGSLCRQCG